MEIFYSLHFEKCSLYQELMEQVMCAWKICKILNPFVYMVLKLALLKLWLRQQNLVGLIVEVLIFKA